MSQTLWVGYRTYCSTDTHKVSKGVLTACLLSLVTIVGGWAEGKGTWKAGDKWTKVPLVRDTNRYSMMISILSYLGARGKGGQKWKRKKGRWMWNNAFYTSLYTFLDEKIYHVNLPNDPMIKSDNRTPQKKPKRFSCSYVYTLHNIDSRAPSLIVMKFVAF
jgi:hypothetical protein